MTFNAATPPLRSHAGHLEDVWTLQRVSTTLREVACQLSEGLGRCWGQGLEPIRVLVTKSPSPLGAGTRVQAIAQLAQHVIEVVPAISSSARTRNADLPPSGSCASISRRSSGVIHRARNASSVGASSTSFAASLCLYSSPVTGMARPSTLVTKVNNFYCKLQFQSTLRNDRNSRDSDAKVGAMFIRGRWSGRNKSRGPGRGARRQGRRGQTRRPPKSH